MRTRNLLRLVGACSLVLATSLSVSTPASAWAGLSDKQKAHIEEFFHCNLLMWTDLDQFEAEQPPCGGTPNASALSSSGGTPRFETDQPCYRYPDEGSTSRLSYCPE